MADLTLTAFGAAIPMHRSRIIALPQSHPPIQAEVYRVPRGMRLTIEYVSMACTAKANADHAVQRFRLGTTVGGELVFHDVQTINGRADWSGTSHLVRIYADPGSSVRVLIERVFRPKATARVSISGILEPIAVATLRR
jgi:hypothetical protein